MSCRIVAKCKSAKQRCRKLAYGQRLARPTSLRRGPPEKAFCLALGAWCGQVVEAAGSLGVRIWRLSRVSDRSMEIAAQLQGMASAGNVKGAKGILARGLRNRKRGEHLSGWVWIRTVTKVGPRGGPIFGSVLATSLFPNLYSLAVLFLGPPSGLCFGAALRPALCVLVAGRSLHERNVFGLHFLGLQGAALRLRARQPPVGNAPLSAVRGSLAFPAIADALAAQTVLIPVWHRYRSGKPLGRLQPACPRNVPFWKHCFCHQNMNARAVSCL